MHLLWTISEHIEYEYCFHLIYSRRYEREVGEDICLTKAYKQLLCAFWLHSSSSSDNDK